MQILVFVYLGLTGLTKRWVALFVVDKQRGNGPRPIREKWVAANPIHSLHRSYPTISTFDLTVARSLQILLPS